jgi:hypothetical protein
MSGSSISEAYQAQKRCDEKYLAGMVRIHKNSFSESGDHDDQDYSEWLGEGQSAERRL